MPMFQRLPTPPCPDLTPCVAQGRAPGLTHPATAWLAQAVPIFLALGLVLILVAVFHTRLGRLVLTTLERQARQRRREPVDPALIWVPPVVAPTQVVLILTLAALLLIATLSLIAPTLLALVLAFPVTVVVGWLLLVTYTVRYREQLDRTLPAAVGRLGAQLRSGNSFQIALQRVTVDLSAGPLKTEWHSISERVNLPLVIGGMATPTLVVRALAAQTSSRRHAALLGHLEVALQQTHEVQVRRVEAAYQALQDSERQRSAATTELAQMRYSGMAVGGAGLFMAVYLALTQWERTVTAYSSPLGLLVGPIVLTCLLLPIVGGFVLARADDVDY